MDEPILVNDGSMALIERLKQMKENASHHAYARSWLPSVFLEQGHGGRKAALRKAVKAAHEKRNYTAVL